MTIKLKLFLLIVLPTITILLFSVNHIIDKYNSYQSHEILLSSSNVINNISSVMHELQLERGLSSSYINASNKSLKDTLFKQHKKSDKAIKEFNEFIDSLGKNHLLISNHEFINKINILLQSIENVRKGISTHEVTKESSFSYYTYINYQLLELAQSIKFYSNDDKLQTNIITLTRFLALQEFLGQERAFISQLNHNIVSEKELERLNNILDYQNKISESIKITLQDSNTIQKYEQLEKSSSDNNYIQEVKNNIQKSKNRQLSIDDKKWFDITSNKIDNLYILGKDIFWAIVIDIEEKNQQLYKSFIFQIAITATTIFSLLLGAYFLARNINSSLKNLNKGMDNFFDFLNFHTSSPKKIETDSNDELGNIADKINMQILFIKEQLEKDKEFINETTTIVQNMKNGIFYQKATFEPINPYLINLKAVFNELSELISNKITEQTLFLEELNKELKNKVDEQTKELKTQILEITKARDEAIEAQKTKDEFLANMSHEIRTPLNAILGFVKILQKQIKDEKSLNYLDVISASGSSLLNIINDILDFSKIQSNKFTLYETQIEPVEEFSKTALLFASKASEKDITYIVYIDPNMPRLILIDDVKVKQILSNLLSNAIKFTKEDGFIEVKITIKDNSLIISVKDNGIGIPLSSQENIFKPFTQADGSTTRKYGGTGLGLSISLELAHLMHGELIVESKEAEGSIFTLSIPITIIQSKPKKLLMLEKIKKYRFAILTSLKEDKIFCNLIKKYFEDFGITNYIEINDYIGTGYDILFFIPDSLYNEEIIEAKIPSIAMLKSNMLNLASYSHIASLYAPFTPMSIIESINDVLLENIKETTLSNNNLQLPHVIGNKFEGNVLIAEDNKTNQLLMALILDEYGLNYKIANNGNEAVNLFKESHFDLVLMDENMPELCGIDALKQIREYEKQNSLNKTPVVAVTANALSTDKEKFLNAGMDGFISKPIDNKLLEKELDKFLKKLNN